ncbi:hypothetical protein IM40_00145 [Candidatus Paracaedimonas acanthamoebae]|nr:hypothetical protein IM40_00145 [Candidatus Paracaedimonas acanthamoebae]
MKKILVLSAHSFSLDRRIIAQLNALDAKKYSVTLVSVPIQGDFKAEVSPSIRIIHQAFNQIPSKKQKIFTCICSLLATPVANFIKFIYRRYIEFYKTTKYLIKNTPCEEFDYIHAHDLSTLKAAYILRHRLKVKKVLYDSHELWGEQFPLRIEANSWNKLEVKLCKRVDAIIAVNDSIKTILSKRITNSNIITILNSYGISPFQKQSGFDAINPLFLSAKKTKNLVLFQGSLGKERNLENLTLAFEYLKDQATLLFLGEGPLKQNLQEIVTKNNLSNVIFHDWVLQSELISILKKADLGIIPYLGDKILNNHYCTPNKLFEYIHARVPICASNLPELVKFVDGYKIGKTHSMLTPLSIAEAIKNMLELKANDYFPLENFLQAEIEIGWPAQEKKLLNLYTELEK